MNTELENQATPKYSLGTELFLYLLSAIVAPPLGGVALSLGIWLREDDSSQGLALNVLVLSLVSAFLFLLVMVLSG